MSDPRPRVAVTVGDPAGIGPEILLKALAKPEIQDICVPVVFGNPRVLEEVMPVTGLSPDIRPINDVRQAEGKPESVDLIDLGDLPEGSYSKGHSSAETGNFTGRCLETAIGLAKSGEVDSVIMGPTCKKANNAGGYRFAGFRETVNHMAGEENTILITLGRVYNLARVTTHVPLSKVPELCTRANVLHCIRLLHQGFRNLGYGTPRIGVSGLNPHAGEEGLLGSEEIEEIIPAMEEARAEGIDARGPYPGDTIFFKMRDGEVDVILSMFHDHGNACIKLVEFGTLVNYLAGLPIRVFTVMHGTAFDIAGTGKADATNLEYALYQAAGQRHP